MDFVAILATTSVASSVLPLLVKISPVLTLNTIKLRCYHVRILKAFELIDSE